MATGWNLNNTQKALNPKGVLDDNDLVMKYILAPQKSGIDLMQNCDLPPPIKVFPGSVDKTVIHPMNKKKSIYTMMVQGSDGDDGRKTSSDTNNNDIIGSVDDDKLELLKALRLSQTRAREAEMKYSSILKEKDLISFAVLDESMQVFAYRQLIQLLELQVNRLKVEKDWRRKEVVDEVVAEEEGSGGDGLGWVMALAFCLGIAGVGFAAFGYRCYWF